VAPLHLEQAQNLYKLLATLEDLALRAAHGKLSESDFQTLQFATDELANALAKKDALAATLADLAFHSDWVRRAANPQLEKSVEECRMKLRRIEIRYFHRRSDVRQSLQEHRAISVALERHSLQEALRELRHHWQASTERCLMQLANPPSKTAHRISEGK
jgi:DNA-binding GntR family transcriptional regulator